MSLASSFSMAYSLVKETRGLFMKVLTSVLTVALFLFSNVGFCTSTDTARQTFESAMQALNAGEYSQAEAGFHKVLALDPRNVSALANHGVLYARTHRYTKAILAYKQALRISPQQRETQLNLGLAYMKQEDYTQAGPYFKQLHDQDPSNHQATMLLATCLTFSGHAEDGIGLLKPLTEAGDQDSAALYLLGVAYSRAGQPQQAQGRLYEALRE